MSVRYLCDLCDKSVEEATPQREFKTFVEYIGGGDTVDIQILRSVKGVWNGGHICNECLMAALLDVLKQLKQQTSLRGSDG